MELLIIYAIGFLITLRLGIMVIHKCIYLDGDLEDYIMIVVCTILWPITLSVASLISPVWLLAVFLKKLFPKE